MPKRYELHGPLFLLELNAIVPSSTIPDSLSFILPIFYTHVNVFNLYSNERLFPQFYRLALKRFPSNKRKTFEREKLAFEALCDQDGLIHYITAYQTTDDQQETHYNILLEFAELDLYQVFRKEEPPVSPDKIKAFWDAMLGLCRVLEAIRTVKFDDEPFDV